MVLQKRLETGSVGCHIPTTPRFPRSARGKRSPPKKVMDSQMRAFDLLATVAGEILAERDNAWTLCKTTGITSPVNKIKLEQLDNGSPFKSDVFDQGSCDESSFVARLVSHGQVRHIFEENLNNPDERSASLALVKSDASKKDAFAKESIPKKCFSKGQSSSLLRSCECELDGQIITPLQAKQTTGSLKIVDVKGIRNLEDSMDMDSSAPALVGSDSSVEIPPCGGCFSARSSSFHSIRDGMELHVDRDDDENSSNRTHCGTIHSKAFKPHCTGEHRVRKMMKSNYWKADRELMDDGVPSNVDVEMKPVFRNRKMRYTRQRTQRSSFKRGKFIERSSFSASNGGFCGEDISDSQVKDGIKIDTSDPQAAANGANGRSTTSQRFSYESTDHPVKMSIKSFKVPELFIEIPANATVGSLKRTVMEAVSAILSGGLRVGVLLQGKKMRDDNKTLLQAGISHTDKLDSLGFTLEPNPTQTPLLHHFNPYEPETLNKIHAPAAPAAPAARALNQETSEGSAQATANPTTICPESDYDSVHSPTPSSPVDKIYDNSKALVPIPSMNDEALAVVSHRNSRRSDMAQRRIRRPFSVSEVEALVQAVEKLGTGRWRDVKLRAFDSAKHRTYVDLKDKWKTLVHTARISPQQRRGEPVPQELLDRVLLAHAYWSQQQAKLQIKPIGQIEPCLHMHKPDADHELGGGGCIFNHV